MKKVKDDVKEKTPEKLAPEVIRTILQDGVDFEVTPNRKTLWNKPRKFMIYPVNLGTLYNISKIILTMKNIEALDNQDLFAVGVQNIIENKDKMIEVVALGILNRKIVTPWSRLKKWLLCRFLDNNLTSNELLKILQLVIVQMDVTDFLASSASVKRLNLVEVAKETKVA